MLPNRPLPCSPTPDSSLNLQLRRLLNICTALTEQLVENNGAECCGTNATKREAADVDGEVASAHCEGNCRRHQVAALGEVHVILYPDAPAGGGNQAKENDGKPAEHTYRDGSDQGTKLWAEPQENSDNCCDNEDHSRIDAGHCHNSDIFCVSGQTSSPARCTNNG